MRRLMLENGMEVAPLGNSKIEVGQFTIANMNAYQENWHQCKSKLTRVKYVCVWLDNADVIIPQKYADIPVMTESTVYPKVGNQYVVVTKVQNKATYSETKSAFGVGIWVQSNESISTGRVRIVMKGHAIFNVVPETYNYMIVYE